MFILKSQDIEYCQAHEEQFSHRTMCYRGFVFKKVGNTKDTRSALKLCRQFLDLDNPIASLILKDPNNITVWVEVKQANLTNRQVNCCSISNQDSPTALAGYSLN